MDKHIVSAILIFSIFSFSSAIDIQCDFKIRDFYVLEQVYSCEIQNNLTIDSLQNANIASVSGTHESGKTNDDVIGLYSDDKGIDYFPKGIEKIFKNLKAIWLDDGRIKEIHQADLKVFPNLVEFYLDNNKIEVVEEGLFDLNPNLQAVSLSSNNVSYVHPKVFDNLRNLKYLWFTANKCIDAAATDSREGVTRLIKQTQCLCQNLSEETISTLSCKFGYLEDMIKTLKENVNSRIESLEGKNSNMETEEADDEITDDALSEQK